MSEKETISCPDCKQTMEVVTPELSVINHEDMSILFGLHPLGFGCNSCGSYFKPAIAGAERIKWAWMKVDSPLVQLVKPNGRIRLAN